MFHDIVGVDEQGKSISLVDPIVADLTNAAEDPVQLTDILEFAPLPDLVGTMASPDGTVRDDISVTFGLFGIPAGSSADGAGSQTLGFVTSAPTSATNVSAGDELVFDVGQLEALNDYKSVLLDYLFGRAKPAGGDVEENLAPPEVLSARFAAETVEWSGVEVEGDMEAGMWSRVAGNPDSAAARANIFTTADNRDDAAEIVQTSVASRLMGFPVKSSFTGAPGLALTAYCIVAGALVAGPAGVVVGAVFCGAVGTIMAVNDAMNAIEDNTPGGKPRPGRPGTSSGEPHLTTFDGARHDLMAVGEFDMFIMDGMRLQLRTKPCGTSKPVSINIAAAMDVAGDTIVTDSDSEKSGDIVVNDEPTTLEIGTPIDLPGGGIVKLVGNAVDVEWRDVRQPLWSVAHTRPGLPGLQPRRARRKPGFAKRAAIDQAIHNPLAFLNFNRSAMAAGTGATFEGTHLTAHAGQMDQAGHALIQLRHNEGDRYQLYAVTVADGEKAWSVPMQDSTCGVAVAGADRIVVPGVDDDGFLFQFVDSESGSVEETVPSPFNDRDCRSMVASDDTVVVSSGGKEPMLLGLNSSTGDVSFEQSVPDMTAGPNRSEDGTIWVITEKDDRIDAHKVDTKTGKVKKATTIPGKAITGASGFVPTANGFVVTAHEEESSATVRVTNGGVAWRTKFPIDLDGRALKSPDRISVDAQTIAGYTMSSSSFMVLSAANLGNDDDNTAVRFLKP